MKPNTLTRDQFYAHQHISDTAKILTLLKEKRVVTNRELNKICFRYSARIHELRGEDHIIVTNHVQDGLYEYWYHGERKERLHDGD